MLKLSKVTNRIAVDHRGDIYLVEIGDKRIVKMSRDKTVTLTFGSGEAWPIINEGVMAQNGWYQVTRSLGRPPNKRKNNFRLGRLAIHLKHGIGKKVYRP